MSYLPGRLLHGSQNCHSKGALQFFRINSATEESQISIKKRLFAEFILSEAERFRVTTSSHATACAADCPDELNRDRNDNMNSNV
jgi:hypothetical protein